MPHLDEVRGMVKNLGQSQGSGGPHTHPTSDVQGLDAALAEKAAVDHTHEAQAHSHAVADVTGLQAALDGKAASDHSHPGSGAALASAFLTATQANSTVTPAVLTGHTFTLTPGQVLQLVGQVVCTGAATTTGFAVGVRVAQAATANGNAVGSACFQVGISNAAAATQLFDADIFNVGAGSNAFVEVVGSATTAGNNGAGYHLAVKNTSSNVNTTVTIEFRSEVAGSAVTAQIGTGCAGVKG